MWNMTLPPKLATVGRTLESTIAPKFYRRTPIVTLSNSSKHELVDELGFKQSMVHVVPPGIDPRFTPGGDPSPTPLVVAVGRLVPVKRFEMLVESIVELRTRHPRIEAVIVGEGYRREALEAQIREAGAERYISLPGRITDDEVIDLYRRAWVLASASAREGWGMTLTEAAACGTPAVVTRIAGHADAVAEGRSGLLADGRDELTAGIDRVLSDSVLRTRLSMGALAHAEHFTWAATARGTLEVLAAEALRRRPR
jgi:glycosyltransferase involved in cell wall biosynthesis